MKFVLIAAAAVVLTGCMSTGGVQQTNSNQGVWLRTDGQSGRTNPALAQQFEVDKASCTDQGQVNQLCMAHRGYILVPENQAEAKAAELRAAQAAQAAQAGI